LRRVAARHILLCTLAITVVCVLVFAGAILFAYKNARENSEATATNIAASVVKPLSSHRLTQLGEARNDVSRELQPFVSSHIVYRVKVWSIDGDRARIVYSDEARLEGTEIRLGPAQEKLHPEGDVEVQAVPHDYEHRFETTAAKSLLEVFVTFRDAGGARALLEMYVPTDIARTEDLTAITLIPLLAVGLGIFALATLPVSLQVARRSEEDRAEQRAARRYGFSSAEIARLSIARNIHNEVIPSLGGARMLLELAQRNETVAPGGSSDSLLIQAHHLVEKEMHVLRRLLGELVPTDPAQDAVMEDLVDRVRRGHHSRSPAVIVTVETDTTLEREIMVPLFGIAEELLRNVFKHAQATRVEISLRTPLETGTVKLTVVDDGIGIPGDMAVKQGVGLTLADKLAEDLNGSLTITSSCNTGTTVVVALPLLARPLPSQSLSSPARRTSRRKWRRS
jgi:signal transduction histidine kinase